MSCFLPLENLCKELKSKRGGEQRGGEQNSWDEVEQFARTKTGLSYWFSRY